MNILMLGSFGLGALELYYLKGLLALGVDCHTFDITKEYYNKLDKSIFYKAVNKVYPGYFFDDINQRLLHLLDGKMYDVILTFKGMTLYPDTIQSLKRFTRLLCCYNPDHPLVYYSSGSGNKNILNSIQYYDVYISYSIKIVEQLKGKFQVQSFVLPFGFDDEEKPTSTMVDTLKGQFAFIGAYDVERKNIMESLSTQNLKIFGDEKWRSRTSAFSKSRKHYCGLSLYGQEYIDAISAADGVINILRQQNLVEESHNMRTFEVPGYGGVLISNRTEEQQQFFEEGKEAIYYDTIDELNDKVRFLERNQAFVNNIKMNAWNRSQKSGYGYRNRSAELLRTLEKLYLN